ncbi:hypothetical protein [Acetobacter indonesiensis]|uniref:hypothetical protein n=1 Tax=Acetobacter indonesiensis TaxID=104101 RepID=UPI001178993E|nr:hypothetical protein [Acetobacter indonesiensis]
MDLRRSIAINMISTWTNEIINKIPASEWKRWGENQENSLLILVGATFFSGEYQQELRLEVSSGNGPAYVTGSNIHEGLWGKPSVERALKKLESTPEADIAQVWIECEKRLYEKNNAWPSIIREGVSDAYGRSVSKKE